MDMKGIPHSEGNITKGMGLGQMHDVILERIFCHTVSSPMKPGPKILKPYK